MRKIVADQLRIIVPVAAGTAVYAFGLHYFVLANQFMEGGVTGIAILLNYAFGWPLSVTTLCLNVPLFLIGWRRLGGRQMWLTVFGTVSLSFFLWLMERLTDAGLITPFAHGRDLLLAALYAGASLGAGLGVVFRFGATTGGADIIARMLSRAGGWSMGQVIMLFDAAIITLSLLFIPIERVLYTLIVVFIAGRMIDYIQAGAYSGKAFSIVTERGGAVAAAIGRQLERGATLLPAVGAYSGADKQIVYCVVARQEVRRLKQIVRAEDPAAFIVVSDAHDVIGEGFRET